MLQARHVRHDGGEALRDRKVGRALRVEHLEGDDSLADGRDGARDGGESPGAEVAFETVRAHEAAGCWFPAFGPQRQSKVMAPRFLSAPIPPDEATARVIDRTPQSRVASSTVQTR
jgi:hypothetical protein